MREGHSPGATPENAAAMRWVHPTRTGGSAVGGVRPAGCRDPDADRASDLRRLDGACLVLCDCAAVLSGPSADCCSSVMLGSLRYVWHLDYIAPLIEVIEQAAAHGCRPDVDWAGYSSVVPVVDAWTPFHRLELSFADTVFTT